MNIIRNYRRYKRILQTLFIVNIFLVLAGIVALIQYIRSHDLSSFDLFLVGIGTLTFGIVIPIVVLDRLFETIKEMRHHTEETVAKLVAGWLEYYRRADDPMTDPLFWVNIGLLTAEVISEHSRHPVGRVIAEFAPMVKAELNKSARKVKSKKDS